MRKAAVTTPSSTQFDADALQRAEERLALHELIRVAFPAGPLPVLSGRNQLRECALREEWRCSREQHLLSNISTTSLVSCSDADSQHQLFDQLCALQQIEDEQRAMTLRKQQEAGAQARRSGSIPASRQRHGPPRAPGRSLQQQHSNGRTAAAPVGTAQRSTAAALGLYSSSVLRGSSSRLGTQQSSPSKPLTPTRALGPSPYASSSLKRPGTGVSGPLLTGGVDSSSSRPISAPPARPPKHGPNPYGSQSPAVPSHATRSDGTAAGSGEVVASSRSGSTGGVRFQQLYKLHNTLLRNLEGHKAASGAGVATSALEANIQEAQAVFARCMHEASELVEQLLQQQEQEAERPGTRGGQPRGLSWDRMLRLGELGLTTADVARLHQLRQAQAARLIQQAARRWLQLRRHLRAVEQAQRRAAEMRRRLRQGAAVIIQSCWRGRLGRKAAAEQRVQALRERRQSRVEALRRRLAATRIQRCFRAWRKRRKAWRAMGLPPPSMSSASGGPDRGVGFAGQTDGCSQSRAWSATGSSSVQQLSEVDSAVAHKSAALIQAHVRGWLVRRSCELWWARSLAELRGRRAVAAAWSQHRQHMMQTFGLQQLLVETILREAELSQSATQDATRERLEFEAAWGAWLGQQLASAMSQPLPRGWVPQPDPASGSMCFLNTRTGELHAYHPAVQQLRGFITEQRVAAEKRQAAREDRVAAYLQSVHQGSLKAQADLLKQMSTEQSQ